MADGFSVHPARSWRGIESDRPADNDTQLQTGEGGPDTVAISLAAKLAAKVQSNTIVRTELVERVRHEIRTGTYETPERIDATVDALLEELFSPL
jgi:anti-sigma28 factor (negative regulator of flagellin synthesis)